MKSFAIALCGSMLLVALGQAQGGADELDDLLAGNTNVAQQESAAQSELPAPASNDAVSPRDDVVSPREDVELDYTNHAHWQPVVALPSSAESVSGQSRTAEAPSAFSAVPEPSAIALAMLALVYFLVFGRRRFAV